MTEKSLTEADWKKFSKGRDYKDAALLKGLNVVAGKVTYQGVAEAFGMEYHEPAQFVK